MNKYIDVNELIKEVTNDYLSLKINDRVYQLMIEMIERIPIVSLKDINK